MNPKHGALMARRQQRLHGEQGIAMMTESRGAANAKAKRELGWQPRFSSWRDGFRDGLSKSAA